MGQTRHYPTLIIHLAIKNTPKDMDASKERKKLDHP
jgi:hypothetical protein